jgi:hypothetical protein
MQGYEEEGMGILRIWFGNLFESMQETHTSAVLFLLPILGFN